MAWQRHWHHHPGVRSGEQLTLGERSADKLRNGMGSWPFVIAALVFLAAWMVFNEVIARHADKPFDPYPFILLNLVLSCLAALQGAILLIAAKRADQISSELARHDYETDVEADETVKAIHLLTMEIHARLLVLEGGPLGGRQLVNRAPDSTEGSAAPDGPPG